eukprot:COSAG02_NODE_174_length_31243_cov_76.084543_10_plen_68_part_00
MAESVARDRSIYESRTDTPAPAVSAYGTSAASRQDVVPGVSTWAADTGQGYCTGRRNTRRRKGGDIA